LIEYLQAANRRLVIVATKADKLSGNGKAKAARALTDGLGAEEILLCSARTGAGLKELWAAIYSVASI
jgi:GTP-binding protein